MHPTLDRPQPDPSPASTSPELPGALPATPVAKPAVETPATDGEGDSPMSGGSGDSPMSGIVHNPFAPSTTYDGKMAQDLSNFARLQYVNIREFAKRSCGAMSEAMALVLAEQESLDNLNELVQLAIAKLRAKEASLHGGQI